MQCLIPPGWVALGGGCPATLFFGKGFAIDSGCWQAHSRCAARCNPGPYKHFKFTRVCFDLAYGVREIHKTCLVKLNFKVHTEMGELRWTPSFRPLSAENKMGSRGLLPRLLLFVCRSFCALKPFGNERTSRAWHCPSSPSVFFGFQYLPPQSV